MCLLLKFAAINTAMIFKRDKKITLHKCERKEIKIPRETRRNPLSMFFAHREREREIHSMPVVSRLKNLQKVFAACEKKAPAICPILKNCPMQRRNDVIEPDMAMVFQIWSKLTGRLTSQ